MTEYVHLIGAEEVGRAAGSMRVASDEMQRAASNIEDALRRHQIFLDDWLARLDATLQYRVHDLATSQA